MATGRGRTAWAGVGATDLRLLPVLLETAVFHGAEGRLEVSTERRPT